MKRITHTFYVKELPIEIRRRQWREEELAKRKSLFLSIVTVTPLYLKIYNLLKNKVFC